MKSVVLVLAWLSRSARGRNLRLVVWLLVALVVLVTVFSVVFHLLMAREGRDHSWLTGFYWTMT
ncbi:MAG TPA: potassium channel protein, partial [Acidimicrobiales bacterium]